jgi:hypothetical protein
MFEQTPTVAGNATEEPPFDTGGAGGSGNGSRLPANATDLQRKFTTAPNATALIVTKEAYERITNVQDWAITTGQAIAASGMFGVGTPAAGYMIAMHCYLTRTSPLDWARTFHIIEGKQTMRADTILARFREAGGRVEWKKMGDEADADRAEAKFTFEGKSYSIAYTLAEAEKAGLASRSIWRKNPGEMMRARLASKAVRMLAPETIAGVYCPEDLGEGGGAASDATLVPVGNEERTPQIHIPEAPTPAPVAPQVVASPATPAVPVAPVAAVPAAPAATQPVATEPIGTSPSTRGQHSELASLKAALQPTPEKWQAALAKIAGRPITTAKDLTYGEAATLIAKLEDAKRKRLAEAPNPLVEADKQRQGELTAWAAGALAPKS